MLTREDVERITELVISKLKIDIYDGEDFDPNMREVVLTLDGKIIHTSFFYINQSDEYKG